MSFNKKKRGYAKHVQLMEAFQVTEAWATLKPGPRALYVELKRRFNGRNNGRILMSQREAADLLNVHRNTVPGYFHELERRALIRATGAGHLGADGYGIATRWALCEFPVDGKPPDLAYRSWNEGKKPATNLVHLDHRKHA